MCNVCPGPMCVIRGPPRCRNIKFESAVTAVFPSNLCCVCELSALSSLARSALHTKGGLHPRGRTMFGLGLWRRTTTLAPMLLQQTIATPITSFFSPLALAARTMKVVTALKKRCESCRIVKRGTISYVYCSASPRHKARNGPKRKRK